MAANPPPTQRRSHREIKKSLRARESGEPVPGIDFHRPGVTSRAHSPTPNSAAFLSETPSAVPHQYRSRHQAKAAGYSVVTRRESTSKSPAAGPRHTTRPQHYLDSFPLQIYDWPHPIPKNFTHLSDHHKSFKSEQDVKDATNDRDPELDDWYEKCGRAAAYTTIFPESTLEYSIARSFILRAKRLFWAQKSWKSFEDEELLIDSMSRASAVENPARRQLEMEEAIDNTLRLRIFELIKVRLCNEIWLHSYPVNRSEPKSNSAVDGSNEQSDENIELDGMSDTRELPLADSKSPERTTGKPGALHQEGAKVKHVRTSCEVSSTE